MGCGKFVMLRSEHSSLKYGMGGSRNKIVKRIHVLVLQDWITGDKIIHSTTSHVRQISLMMTERLHLSQSELRRKKNVHLLVPVYWQGRGGGRFRSLFKLPVHRRTWGQWTWRLGLTSSHTLTSCSQRGSWGDLDFIKTEVFFKFCNDVYFLSCM